VNQTPAQTHTNDAEVLDLRGIMRTLKLSQSAAKRHLQTGHIPGRKVGRQWRVSKAVLMAWLNGQG
jgi:excisionase family DNA binding protein